MGNVDRVDNRTFKVNFSSDGVEKLRETVKEKLKEFMGDYTDDTLVEYVIVLLRNGRRKEEARNELNVFLGDDSDSFISWLWNHLASCLDLYVQKQGLHNEASKSNNVSSEQGVSCTDKLGAESEGANDNKFARRRHDKEWKDLVREGTDVPPLGGSVVFQLEDKARKKVDNRERSSSPMCPVQRKRNRSDDRQIAKARERSSSPMCPVQRKRNRSDDRQIAKKDLIPQVTIDAPRRLLQFAVRDAVATSRTSNLSAPAEPTSKRLRSVVSSAGGDSSTVDREQRIHSVTTGRNPLATVIKAVAEAAEDVRRVKYSGSVFDRLGRAIDPLETDVGLVDDIQNQEQLQPKHFQSGYSDMTAMKKKGRFASDFPSDDDGYDNISIFNQDISGARKGEDLLMVQYDVEEDDDDVMLLKQSENVSQQAIAPKMSFKTGHFATNKGPWKQPHLQESHAISGTVVRKSLVDGQSGHLRSSFQAMKENGNTVKINDGNPKPAADTQEERPKTQSSNAGLFPSGRSLEDADSRTIFVSNVHFAATKDSLSRHFNKFGEVLKVIVLTDAATGQPKGAAYVEFMRKEAADNALSLDGTSFMSRMIKVVKSSAAPQESSQTITWPPRASPLGASRFGKFPFARGIPGAYRPWPPIKPGARSMQWRRNPQNIPADGAAASGSINSAPATWSRTYVRTQVKNSGSSGNT